MPIGVGIDTIDATTVQREPCKKLAILLRKRVNFLQRKIVADEPDERKEDSDDESEEDEARHPLIVHDRDPEQNLEALRDPSRYRQNLA